MEFSSILLYFTILGLLVYIARKWLVSHWGYVNIEEEENVKGKVVIITGANSGIGRSAALELAKRGATVILACRSVQNAKDAIVYIRNYTFCGKLLAMKLDLGSLNSVNEFYHEILKSYEKIDILINNGGVMIPAREKQTTADGFEINFGVNHVGHFLLTNLLLPLLKNAGSSRIVTVGSFTCKTAKLNFQDLMSEKLHLNETMSVNPLYRNSKLANALFSQELGRKLEGTGVRTYCLCPGVVATSISRHLNVPLHLRLFRPIESIIFRTSDQGCQSILYCALSKKCAHETGLMYKNCELWNNKFTFPDDLIVPGKRCVFHERDAERLWEETEKLIKMKFTC